jgi:hypothetical protein
MGGHLISSHLDLPHRALLVKVFLHEAELVDKGGQYQRKLNLVFWCPLDQLFEQPLPMQRHSGLLARLHCARVTQGEC